MLCGFWTPDHTKVKSHLHQEHRRIWDALQDSTTTQCQKLGTEILKGRPCPFCSKKVTDRRKHPAQCGVLFQILLGDSVLQITRTTTGPLQSFFKASSIQLEPEAKPESLPTAATKSSPKVMTAESKNSHDPAPPAPSLFPPISSPLQLGTRGSTATQQAIQSDPSNVLSLSPSTYLEGLSFKNTSNYCYVNAAVQALLATTILDYAP